MRTRIAVIGGGITGLAAAHRLIAALPPAEFLLVEAALDLGGKIRTDRVDGCLIEGGPDCFLGSRPAGLALCRELGLEPRLQPVRPEFRRSFIRRGNRLYPLPEGLTALVPSRLGPLLTTRVLSPLGRARAALELVIPARRDTDDESVASFVRRRFGTEAWDWMVEPLLGGVYAGDGEQLSLQATFPQLRDAERSRKSVLRAMLHRHRAGAANGGRATQGFLTLDHGLGALVEALVRHLPADRVWTGAPVRRLRAAAEGYHIELADGRAVEARGVIVAVPAHAAAELLRDVNPELASSLSTIPFVSTATVSVAYRSADVPRPLAGTGYVSPRAGGGEIVACTWTTHKFTGRAPDHLVLLRFFLGRAGHEALATASDARVLEAVAREVRQVLGIRAEPALARIFRWPRGLPQYTLGHVQRTERLARLVARHPGLALAGSSYRGVGIPDCIASGRTAADEALASLTS